MSLSEVQSLEKQAHDQPLLEHSSLKKTIFTTPLRVKVSVPHVFLKHTDPEITSSAITEWEFEELPIRTAEHVIARCVTTLCFNSQRQVPPFRIDVMSGNEERPRDWFLNLCIDYDVPSDNRDPDLIFLMADTNSEIGGNENIAFYKSIISGKPRENENGLEAETLDAIKDPHMYVDCEPRPLEQNQNLRQLSWPLIEES
jgi:hypothetical protein